MISALGLASALTGWYSTAFGALIFYPEVRATIHKKPHELSRDTFLFYILWLIGDGAQLAGLYIAGNPLLTQLMLNYSIAVLETLMLLLLLYYAGHLSLPPLLPLPLPTSYLHKQTHQLENSTPAVLVRSSNAFLGASRPGMRQRRMNDTGERGDSMGVPGSAELPGEWGRGEMEGREGREEEEGDEVPLVSGVRGNGRGASSFSSSAATSRKGKKGKNSASPGAGRWEMRIVLTLALVAATVTWYLVDLRNRTTGEDPPEASFPETLKEWTAYVLLGVGLVCWVTPRALNIARSITRKKPEEITTYGIFTMGNAHSFNIISVVLINHTGPTIAAQLPYLLNSGLCLVLDCIRFYLKHRYSRPTPRQQLERRSHPGLGGEERADREEGPGQGDGEHPWHPKSTRTSGQRHQGEEEEDEDESEKERKERDRFWARHDAQQGRDGPSWRETREHLKRDAETKRRRAEEEAETPRRSRWGRFLPPGKSSDHRGRGVSNDEGVELQDYDYRARQPLLPPASHTHSTSSAHALPSSPSQPHASTSPTSPSSFAPLYRSHTRSPRSRAGSRSATPSLTSLVSSSSDSEPESDSHPHMGLGREVEPWRGI